MYYMYLYIDKRDREWKSSVEIDPPHITVYWNNSLRTFPQTRSQWYYMKYWFVNFLSNSCKSNYHITDGARVLLLLL